MKCKKCGMTLDLVYSFLVCLGYKKLKFESYQDYPNEKFKYSQIRDVAEEIGKMREIRDGLKERVNNKSKELKSVWADVF